ncbi:MAG: iron-sulfur cluster assembly scaffold protein [bacterium]|nr:iron-sulfur cluster assembly scaffold protein [bacterium]
MSTNLTAFKRIWELSKDSPYMAKIDNPDFAFSGDNAVCGDWMELAFRMHKDGSTKLTTGKIAEARFLHTGCAVSAVAASVLMEYAEGKTLDEVRKVTPEEQLKLFGAPVSPARIKCALLPLEVLKMDPKKKR